MIYWLKFMYDGLDEYYSYGDADYYFEADSDEQAMELAAAEEEARNAGCRERRPITARALLPHLPHAADLIPEVRERGKEVQQHIYKKCHG